VLSLLLHGNSDENLTLTECNLIGTNADVAVAGLNVSQFDISNWTASELSN